MENPGDGFRGREGPQNSTKPVRPTAVPAGLFSFLRLLLSCHIETSSRQSPSRRRQPNQSPDERLPKSAS